MMRRIFAALFLMLFVSCAALNIAANADLQRRWGTKVSCYIGTQASADLPLLTELYPELEWTAYAQSEPCEIENDSLPGRSAQLPVLSCSGDPDRILFFPLRWGRLPLAEEYDACALDANTAHALFSSAELDGSSIRLNGKILRVVGVVDVDSPLLLIPAESEAELEYLAADDRESMLQLASALGVEIDPFELSGAELAKLMWIPCALPWALAAVLLLMRLRRRGGWRRDAANLAILTLCIAMLLLAMRCVPVRLLPSRWSDLSFYGEQARAFSARPYRMPNIYTEQQKRDALRTLLRCAAACVILYLERMWLRCEGSR